MSTPTPGCVPAHAPAQQALADQRRATPFPVPGPTPDLTKADAVTFVRALLRLCREYQVELVAGANHVDRYFAMVRMGLAPWGPTSEADMVASVEDAIRDLPGLGPATRAEVRAAVGAPFDRTAPRG